MIRVRFDRDEPSMEITGHAGAGKYGSDLVCAAASILLHTLTAALQDRGESFLPVISTVPGEARISCNALPRALKACRDIFSVIFTGYELLEIQYPQYVATECFGAEWREE